MTIRHIRKCNRCKREDVTAVSSPHPVSGTWGRIMVAQGNTIAFPEPSGEGDLCPGCFESMKQWWGNEGTDAAQVDSSLTPLADRAVNRVLGLGGIKRGKHDSYLTDGRPVSRHTAALMRHFAAAIAGETTDEESGEHPLAHVVGRGRIALELILRGDDATVCRGAEESPRKDACPHLRVLEHSSGCSCLDCGKCWPSGEHGAGAGSDESCKLPGGRRPGFDSDLFMPIGWAIEAAQASPCAKTQRGVCIWKDREDIARGYNHQPEPMTCDGSDACRSGCGKLCVHAERHALNRAGNRARGADLVHVEVVDGKAVVSGPPSCWQCSRDILEAGIRKVWLFHDDGFAEYTAREFHEITLKHHGLPVVASDAAPPGGRRP